MSLMLTLMCYHVISGNANMHNVYYATDLLNLVCYHGTFFFFFFAKKHRNTAKADGDVIGFFDIWP